jgi:hypothetical protein
MRGDILGCSENGEITIDFCSSNSEKHNRFIHRTDDQHGAGVFHAERGGAGFSIKMGRAGLTV